MRNFLFEPPEAGGFDSVSPNIQRGRDHGLAENPENNSHVGELTGLVIKRQFEASRDANRYWYERALIGGDLEQVRNTCLSDVIRRNTLIDEQIQDDAFSYRPTPPLVSTIFKRTNDWQFVGRQGMESA